MKVNVKQSDKKSGFTIVELLTIMSIIIILIGMLVPALNQVRRFARKVKQKNQFHSIEAALELFNNVWDGYPPSEAQDNMEVHYCGAMKLCEAMMGQDLMGFHPDSLFRSNGTAGPVGSELPLYPDDPTRDNLTARKGPYLPLENANAYRLNELYENIGPFEENKFVLCDVYTNVTHKTTGKRIGMPLLYYKANLSGTLHPTSANQLQIDDPAKNIYNYQDNHELVKLGMPWNPPPDGLPVPLYTSPTENFYDRIWNDRIQTADRPYRADSYILLSAGFDGEHGTGDDVFNFGD